MKIGKYARAAALGAALLCPNASLAIDVAAGDYRWLGDGTDLFITYLRYSEADTFSRDGASDVPGSKNEASSVVLRRLAYREIAGQRLGFQAVLPLASIKTTVGGATLNPADGLGDLTLGVSYWPLSDNSPTGATLGTTLYVTLPTGKFDRNAPSIGSGTVTITPQVGFIKGLGHKLYFDGTIDTAFAFDKDHDGHEYSRNPETQVQAYLRYQVSPTTSIAGGYSGKFGGRRYVDDQYTMQNGRRDQLRLYFTTSVTRTEMIQLALGKDIHNDSGFSGGFDAQIRYSVLLGGPRR